MTFYRQIEPTFRHFDNTRGRANHSTMPDIGLNVKAPDMPDPFENKSSKPTNTVPFRIKGVHKQDTSQYPANKGRWPNVALLLGQRRMVQLSTRKTSWKGLPFVTGWCDEAFHNETF